MEERFDVVVYGRDRRPGRRVSSTSRSTGRARILAMLAQPRALQRRGGDLWPSFGSGRAANDPDALRNSQKRASSSLAGPYAGRARSESRLREQGTHYSTCARERLHPTIKRQASRGRQRKGSKSFLLR